MPRMLLVRVVGGLVLEVDVQGHVEAAVVDGPVELGRREPRAHEHAAVVPRQVLEAGRDEARACRLGAVVEGEVHVVGQDHGAYHVGAWMPPQAPWTRKS